jgi:hypothetical protein
LKAALFDDRHGILARGCLLDLESESLQVPHAWLACTAVAVRDEDGRIAAGLVKIAAAPARRVPPVIAKPPLARVHICIVRDPSPGTPAPVLEAAASGTSLVAGGWWLVG